MASTNRNQTIYRDGNGNKNKSNVMIIDKFHVLVHATRSEIDPNGKLFN